MRRNDSFDGWRIVVDATGGMAPSLNPVLRVLTGRELFAEERPEQLWKNSGGRHAAIAGQIGWAPGINELCDATQQLYLDMPPWLQWFEERMRRQRQGRRK